MNDIKSHTVINTRNDIGVVMLLKSQLSQSVPCYTLPMRDCYYVVNQYVRSPIRRVDKPPVRYVILTRL